MIVSPRSSGRAWPLVLVAGLATLTVAPALAQDAAWPAPVKGFVPPKPGEHPRLFFRKSDLAELKRRAATPEGQAIVARLRVLLNGKDGQSLPEFYNAAQGAYAGNKPMRRGETTGDLVDATPLPKDLPIGSYTLWHGAGYGMLYQLTGDKKYADLGRKAVELAMDGQRDRDDRYSYRDPGGFLRAGPAVGAIAMAYDLCYDGWEPAFREKVAQDLLNYDGGKTSRDGGGQQTMERLALSPQMHPGSNHWGPQVGGAGLAMLAIQGDPGVDNAKVEKYLAGIEKNTLRQFNEGMGDTGYFHEHPGPGQIASDTAFVPYLQAMRIAGGKDYTVGRPGALWLALRWALWMLPKDGKPFYMNPSPGGSYGTDYFSRVPTVSRSGQFAQGFGLVTDPRQKAALLWVYKNMVEPSEQQEYGQAYALGGKPSFDSLEYPHRAVLALVNWPIGVAPVNPAGIIPQAIGDELMGWHVFRNQWKDGQDILVGALLGARRSTGGERALGPVLVWGLGQRTEFGRFGKGKAEFYDAKPDGSGVLVRGGTCLAVDFSKASGADALLVMTGPGASPGKSEGKVKCQTVTAGDKTFEIMTLSATGQHPEAKAQGDSVAIGKQTIRLDGDKLVLGGK